MLYKRFRSEWLSESQKLFLQSFQDAVRLRSLDEVTPKMNTRLNDAFACAAKGLDMSYGLHDITAEMLPEMRLKIRAELAVFLDDEEMDSYVECVDKALMNVDLGKSVPNPSQRDVPHQWHPAVKAPVVPSADIECSTPREPAPAFKEAFA
ncbi:MAG: hypothetical protein AB7E85_03505 [Pseudobdellovibrionaceae bacterium]